MKRTLCWNDRTSTMFVTDENGAPLGDDKWHLHPTELLPFLNAMFGTDLVCFIPHRENGDYEMWDFELPAKSLTKETK